MKIIENCRIKHLLKRCNEFFSLYLKLYSILKIVVIDTDLSFYKFTNISCIELFVLISSTIVSSPRLFLNFLLFILERARFVPPTFLLSWIIWTLFSTIFPSRSYLFRYNFSICIRISRLVFSITRASFTHPLSLSFYLGPSVTAL